MTKRRKLFYYSEESVTYVEAKGFRARFAVSVIASALAVIGLLFVGNHYFGDVLGIDFERAELVSAENQILKEQIRTLTAKLTDLTGVMDRLAVRDNELRVAVNLPEVDSDTRSLGTGGTKDDLSIGLVSRDAGDLISTSRRLLDRLEGEVTFEEQSYKDIYAKSQRNKDLFAHIPAIKPMTGIFSYHGFGMRMHPILGILRMHEGVDIANETGTPVYATGAGVVEFAGNTGGNYGVALEINHGYGYKTWYAHLLRPAVRPGEKVRRGELIAYSGNSGLSTGPHLHYEVRVNGRQVNPVTYFIDDVDYKQIREQLAASLK